MHPHFQLPLTLRELETKFHDGSMFATGKAPPGDKRWGLGIISRAMVQRLGKVRCVLCELALTCLNAIHSYRVQPL